MKLSNTFIHDLFCLEVETSIAGKSLEQYSYMLSTSVSAL
jgi:hypothetical protein